MLYDRTSYNERLSEMAVGGEAAAPPPPVVGQAATRPIRHIAKPPGVKRNYPLVRCEFIDKPLREAEISINADYFWRCKSETNNSQSNSRRRL